MNDGLFDLDQLRQAPSPQKPDPVPAQERQIDQIRTLFESAGIEQQEDRRSFVESVIGAPAAGLRSLSRFQALQVIDALSRRVSTPRGTEGSAWDDREEETWIDRL